ncbi:hypothetical protein [Priestia megaterium]|uniref:hypothetical protein n=1 Tax=Priestia megaterium TaxID=1404 RepID=UPI00203E05D8|nr:hypothetical protein [Priestia megaterium]MCM3187017.1 hypothetical protein [Priestia megaterium]
MDQTEKLLMGIEHILSVASDLVQEVDRLKRVEEENTIKTQRRSILQKLNASSMKEAIDLYKKTTQTSSQNFTNSHQEIFQKLVKTS